MNQKTLDTLEKVFNSEKKFFKDGYYRIRYLSDKQKELAFLVPDACGATAVHPQITIKKKVADWVAVKLIDLQIIPTQIMIRTPETKEKLDDALQLLIRKFNVAIQDFDDRMANSIR